jgi:hypothetical protein
MHLMFCFFFCLGLVASPVVLAALYSIYILRRLDQPRIGVQIYAPRFFLAQTSQQSFLGHEHGQSESPSGQK